MGLISVALSGTPSSTQHIGLLVETTDTVFNFSSRDGTNTTKVSTGLTSTSIACLTLTLWCLVNASYIWARLYNEEPARWWLDSRSPLRCPAARSSS